MQKAVDFFKKWAATDIAERAWKTFVQAFVATWLLAGQPLSKEAFVAAFAAAVSVTWNWFKKTV